MSDTEILPPSGGEPDAAADQGVRAALEAALLDLEGPPADEPPSTEQDPAPSDSASAEPAGQRPPASWRKEAQAAWESLPEGVRAEVARREAEMQAKLTETDQARKLSEALSAYTGQIAQAGHDPAAYIGNVLAWAAALQGQPERALIALSEQYVSDARAAQRLVSALSQRFNLDGFGMVDDLGDRPAQRDDQTSAQIIQLQQRLQQAELAAAKREWADFVRQNPEAPKMQEAIAKEISANPALTYAEAYERAQWLDPAAREQRLKDDAARKARDAREAARKAGGMALPRGRSVQPPAGGGGTVGESLRATAARLGFKE